MTTLTRIPFRQRRAALAIACLSAAMPLAAAPVAWTNPGTGDWRTGPNWAGGAVPGALDDARLLNGGTALLSGGLATVRSVEIGGAGAGSTLQMQAAPVTLQLAEGGLLVGRSFAGEVMRGTLAAASGRIDISAPVSGAGSITVGRSNGGTAAGNAVIGSVTADRLATVAVGTARGGTALGELSVLGGGLRFDDGMRVGDVSTDLGGMADGRVVVAGALQGRRTGQTLNVGLASGSTGVGTAAFQGRALGDLSASSILDLQSVGVGTTAVSRADDVVAEGRLAAGAIVNSGPAGSLSIGRSLGLITVVEGVGTVRGAATARGTVNLTGDLSGYDTVDIGSAIFSGRADGSLTVDGGDMRVGGLSVGTTLGSASLNVIDGALDARGQLTLRSGNLDLGDGDLNVGAVFNPVPGRAARADGTLQLQDATLTGGRLVVGSGAGATGAVTLQGADSSASLRSLGIGLGEGASGSVVLEGSRLRVEDADPVVGSLNVGTLGGHARLLASDAQIEVSGFVGIGGFTEAGGDGRMQLLRSSLRSDGGIGIGDTGAASIAELALEDSTVTTELLQMGRGADSRLIVDASSVFIEDALVMGDSASLRFGIDGLMAGVGGYGTIDADYAFIAGDVWLDFSDLTADLLPGDPEIHFDLITGRGAWGIFGDFASVNVIAAPTGYGLRWGTVMDGVEVWRLTLSRLDGGGSIPEPTPLGLLAAAAVAAALTRRRR